MHPNIPFTLLTVLASGTIAQAETGTVQGQVTVNGRTPLAGASVALRGVATRQAFGQTTAANGKFIFPALPEGQYELIVTSVGLKPMKDIRVQVSAGQLTVSNVNMGAEHTGAVVEVLAQEETAASRSSPSQSSLAARSATSEVRNDFIREYITPVGDYTQVVQMAPGIFSYSPNGPGLGDTKTYFRGFADGDYTMTFDGIPYQDTNSPSHHSWSFFPTPFLGGAVVDRSPGSASTLGPTNFGGSIQLQSRILEPDQRTTLEGSFGSWNTRTYGAEYESGNLDHGNFLVNFREMKSDGYQTYNSIKQDAFSGKYLVALSQDTVLTLFGSYIDLRSHTPNTKGGTRGQIAQFGDNYLMSNDPAQYNYVGYNFYHVISDFEYAGLASNLGGGWKLDDKLYTYAYHNFQNYENSTTAISATSAIDKLNGYRTSGNILRLSQESGTGILRMGLWSEIANTNRYQIPADPRTWVDAALPNFHETYKTTLIQPFIEYEFHLSQDFKATPGLKYSAYKEDLTQFADNGKTVGNLAGQPWVRHAATYDAALPFFDLHYMLRSNWSWYAQYATGDEIPPTSVFDVKNANVAVLPKSTRNTTLQMGSVYKTDAFTLDVDVYHIGFDNAYSSTTDLSGVTTWYANGKSTSQGVEAESNLMLGCGFNLYLNATAGTAKYDATGQWIQNAPRDTEALGLYYQDGPWNLGLLGKRVGKIFNDNGGTHEAIAIEPFIIPNLFVNYTAKQPMPRVKQARFKLSVNNLNDKHSLVAVTPFAKTSSVPNAGDVLTLLPARSVNFSIGLDF